MSPSELMNSEFAQKLVNALAEQESLIIGGHHLSPEDYVSLIQNVVRKAIAKFNTTIRQNPVAFQQAVIGEVRRDLAEDYLLRLEMSVTNTTFLLGLSEPSAFVRSFKRWTGLSPWEYQTQHKKRVEGLA